MQKLFLTIAIIVFTFLIIRKILVRYYQTSYLPSGKEIQIFKK